MAPKRPLRREGIENTHLSALLQALDRAGAPFDALGGDEIIDPPDDEYGGSSATPANAMVFAEMGVDGVHYALLGRDGVFDDNSPVIQISPFDFDETVSVLAESFLEYLVDGCGTTATEMRRLLEAQTPEADSQLVKLVQGMDGAVFFEQSRLERLNKKWLGLVVPQD